MRRAIRQRVIGQRARDAARRREAAERPYAARRGIHGPRRFRTLYGAQGWCDANWPGGDPEIIEHLTGACWRRDDRGFWSRVGGEPQPDAAAAVDGDPAEPPYWMRPS